MFGYVILCPDHNVSGLKQTLKSIENSSFEKPECVAIVADTCTSATLKEMKEICPTFKAKNTLTSLINLGIKKIKSDWAILIFSGSRIRPHTERKLQLFAKQETDVLFPVVEQKYGFVEGCFNCVVVHTEFFKKVGDFPDGSVMKADFNDFEFAKMLWAIDAISKGAKFKAIVGLRIG